MKKEKKIQDSDWLYASLLGYVNSTFRHSYKKLEIKGMEKIPADAPVIYTPNHTNGLMDALAVLALDNKRKVFVARADIFKDPFQARCLRFLKIMPIMRSKDGLDEVRKNDEIMDKAIDCLNDKVPFCILPEGRNRARHSLMPLLKGTFRIALDAEKVLYGKGMPLYIIPVGLEFGSLDRFRSSLLVQIGDPIPVSQYRTGHEDMTRPQVLNEMRRDLTAALKKITLDVPDNEDYEAYLEICAAMHDPALKKLEDGFREKKEVISVLEREAGRETGKAEELFSLADQVRQERLAHRISLHSIASGKSVTGSFWQALVLLLTLPLTLPSLLLYLPVWGVCKLIFKGMKDSIYYNSFRFAVILILWPFFLLVYAVLGFCFLPWQLALPLLLIMMPSWMYAHDFVRSLRQLCSDLKYRTCPELRASYARIRSAYEGIRSAYEGIRSAYEGIRSAYEDRC